MRLDMHELAHGVVRNNVGVDSIELRVRGRLEGSSLVIAETGQRLPVEGMSERAEGRTEQSWLRFDVRGWEPGETVHLVWLGAGAEPAAFDSAPVQD